MCCGHTTHLCHVNQIQQSQKCHLKSSFFGNFYNKPILSHLDNAIMLSFPTKHRKFSKDICAKVATTFELAKHTSTRNPNKLSLIIMSDLHRFEIAMISTILVVVSVKLRVKN